VGSNPTPGTMAKQSEKYPWSEFEKDCKKIAAWAKRKNFKNIHGIPRGGLIVGVKLSHLLDIPLVLNRENITKNTLIVDDTVDTGGTVERLLSSLGGGFRVASIYFKEDAKISPDFFVKKKKSWVIFPWETKKTSRYDKTY
jgi:hypoxanthine phosphoribosyltransferase